MLVKTNPLPPGYYWVDYDPESAGGIAFVKWVRSDPSKVIARTTETISPGDYWLDTSSYGLKDRIWMLFQVLQPIDFPYKTFGFWPNTTPKGAATVKDDTVQKPEPEKPFDPKALMWTAFWMGLAFYGVTQIPKIVAANQKRDSALVKDES